MEPPQEAEPKFIWDEFPTGFSGDEIVCAAALALEAEGGPGSLEELASRILATANPFRERHESVGLLLAADGLACHFVLGRNTDPAFGERLGPQWSMNGRVFPPLLSTFPDSLESYFECRATQTLQPELRARYSDVLWLRWRRHEAALHAHADYLTLGRGHSDGDASDAMGAAAYLVRAAELAATLNIDPKATISAIRSEVLTGLTRDGAGFATWVVRDTARLLSRDSHTSQELIAAIAAEADVEPAGRRFRQQVLLETAEVLASAMKDGDRALRLRRERGASIEADANERSQEGQILRLALLTDATRVYSEANAGPDVQRLKPELESAGIGAVGEMKRIESEVEIPSEVFERGAAQLVERFGEEELLVLAAGDALGLWPEPAIVERDLTQAMKDYPLQFLFPHTAISTDGRSQPEPDDPGRRQEAQLVRFFASETAARVATSRIVVKVLADQGRWSSVKVVNAISLASSELAAACRPALEELDAGSSWAAAHTLVPQMERALRMLASQSGASVLRASRRGGFEWASLDEMLADDRLDQALGDRLAVAIKRLFSDPNGPNYRNDIAHGAVDPERDLSGATWLAMMAILAICLRSLSTASRAGHATESG